MELLQFIETEFRLVLLWHYEATHAGVDIGPTIWFRTTIECPMRGYYCVTLLVLLSRFIRHYDGTT